MPVSEVLGGLGSWELRLAEHTPDDLIGRLGFFGHLVVVDGPVDVEAAGNALLAGARYVGVCREVGKPDSYTRGGDGLVFWLSDEDGKGHYLETAVTLTGATLSAAVTALLPPTVTLGTVHPQPDPAQRYTGTHQYQSRREALGIVCDVFGVEYRVRGDFAVDVGPAAQLYNTTLPLTTRPSPIIVRRGAGADIDVTAVSGQVQTEGSARDYSTRVLLLGQTVGTGDQPDTVFATGAADAPTVPYKDPQGAPVKLTRVISESGEPQGTTAQRAQLHLNRFNRTTSAIKVTADDYDVEGSVRVGDAAYVYDPDSGITDPGVQVFFHGEVLHPQVVRVSGDTWPIVEGYTVAWRTDAGVWLDLTPWVVWETGQTAELTVGDLPRTLTRGGSANPVADRVDAARPSGREPKTPTGLVLTTTSATSSKGRDAAVITASWNPVTQHTDNTAVALSHYEVQYRPAFRAPLWVAASVTADTSVDLPAVAALSYDVQVRAVSTAGKPSAWSTTASIISAADAAAPGVPSDPVVTSYLGQLRIAWDGLNNLGGAMPADFNRVDVHVSATSGFTPSTGTLVSSLSAAGVAYATAPYGAVRYVKLVAYDHNQNPSAASNQVSGSTVQVADGDVAALSVGKLTAGTMSADVVVAGRFATALTGARREVNSVGFQAWDAANNLTISLDGVDNLLTGRFRTALTGRRIDMGSASNKGSIDFHSPDGQQAQVLAFTSTIDPGVEAIRMRVVPALSTIWQGWTSFQAEGDAVSQSQVYVLAARHEHMAGGDGPETTKEWVVGWATTRGTATTAPTRFRRISINATDTSIYSGPAGSFLLRQWATGYGSSLVRYWMHSNGEHYWYDANGDLRFRLTSSDVWFEWPGTAYRFLVRPGQPTGDESARAQFVNRHNYGATIFAAADSTGNNHRFEIKDAANSTYIPLWASAFTVQSAEASKVGIRDISGGMLDMLRPLKLKAFRRRGPAAADGAPVPDGPEEIGVLAEQMPPQLQVPGEAGPFGVDLGQSVWAILGAVQELDIRLTALEQRRPV